MVMKEERDERRRFDEDATCTKYQEFANRLGLDVDKQKCSILSDGHGGREGAKG